MTQPADQLVPTLREFVLDVAERALSTFAQTFLALYGAGQLDVVHFDWRHTLSIAAGAAVLSLLKSLASPVTGSTTASLTRVLVPRSSHQVLLEQSCAPPEPPPPAAALPSGATAVTQPVTQPIGLPATEPPAPPPKESPRMTALSHVRRPHAVNTSYNARQVAAAYGYDLAHTGRGFTGGIIELGGGFGLTDLRTYFGQLGIVTPQVTAVTVAGGKNTSDGPDGADGEVLLDIEVAAAVAPDAEFRVYFAPNTDAGFLAAVQRAVAECDAVSISWGGPESSWDPATMDAFDQVFAAARAAGVPVFAAAGDAGSRDGTGRNVVDFPASSPSVVGCGGTRLVLNPDGSRKAETVWDDSDTSSATGGGVSGHFPGRTVPDVAGNADPATGYQVLVDGEQLVIGGTSAVAPLLMGMYLGALQATGGKRFDFLNTIATNPQVCFDVTVGDNGGYRAGPGRDDTTGWGVVDFGRLLAVLADPIPDPAPPAPQPSPVPPAPTPVPPASDDVTVSAELASQLDALMARILRRRGSAHEDLVVAKAWESAGI